MEMEPQDLDSWLDQIRPQPIDTRIQADLGGGRLDAVIERALDDERCGRLRPLSDPIQHRAASSFWREYRRLARSIRIQADQQLSLLKNDPLHRSLQLQTIGERQGHAIRSARIALTFRALAIKGDYSYLWFWIGDDESYERAGSPGGGEQRSRNRVRRRNSWLFRNKYWEHCGASRTGYLRDIAEGRAQSVGPSALEFRQTIRRHVLCAMQDEEERPCSPG
jgi:hypothetical protein